LGRGTAQGREAVVMRAAAFSVLWPLIA
jgi:hypothetical protein